MKTKYQWFWKGVKHEIPLCCIMFFENEWQSIRKSNKEYGKIMPKITDNQGIILCPDCLANKIS